MSKTLSLAAAAELNNALTKALTAFTNTDLPGKTSRNSEVAAWKLFLSQRMKSYAEAFNKQAVKDAVEAGVLFDHSKSPRQAGVDEDVYAGDFVRVNLKTKKGSSRVDMALLQFQLVNAGVSEDKWERALAAATKENAAPHTFTASLRT